MCVGRNGNGWHLLFLRVLFRGAENNGGDANKKARPKRGKYCKPQIFHTF